MYGFNNHHHMEENTSSSNYLYNHFSITTTSQTLPLVSNLPPPPLSIPLVNNTIEFDSISPLKSELCNNNSSSSCSSYGSPVTSYNTNDPASLMQRSISSHSLLVKNMEGFCPMVSSPTGFHDSETPSSVRKVLSTGDLQVMHLMQYNNYRSESPLSSESNSIIEGMNKACKYSPQEKKERIERYRSKRNQRNFNKKIKYECRKTLADSRPRIRGRFARNDEIERTSQNEYWNKSRLEELGEEDDENWIGFLDAFVP
ncbi:zinc finger protein HD1-like [Solanum dulcamara]|uniref:zinc finger protein HD1-like n=1 Tax=Solanum dulcamara TaxID=45834 RepID=UPI0024866959|nr:zinc finger protein HD1-like [Solanum dulcamara]